MIVHVRLHQGCMREAVKEIHKEYDELGYEIEIHDHPNNRTYDTYHAVDCPLRKLEVIHDLH